jgi:hemoglobin-like flavoprotein
MKTPHARGSEPDERDIQLFNDSLERCTSSPRFLERFYELFISSSPEVAAKFANTNLRVQKASVKVSLYMIMASIQQKPEGTVHLERIAARHSRNVLDIGPHLYDQWLECLIQAVRECDPVFWNETEQAWRRVMGVGIEFLKSRYANGCPPHPEGRPGLEGGSDPAVGWSARGSSETAA